MGRDRKILIPFVLHQPSRFPLLVNSLCVPCNCLVKCWRWYIRGKQSFVWSSADVCFVTGTLKLFGQVTSGYTQDAMACLEIEWCLLLLKPSVVTSASCFVLCFLPLLCWRWICIPYYASYIGIWGTCGYSVVYYSSSSYSSKPIM